VIPFKDGVLERGPRVLHGAWVGRFRGRQRSNGVRAAIGRPRWTGLLPVAVTGSAVGEPSRGVTSGRSGYLMGVSGLPPGGSSAKARVVHEHGDLNAVVQVEFGE
jgi:hypothetical protein